MATTNTAPIPFPKSPVKVDTREDAMWIEVIAPHFRAIRADRIDGVAVNHNPGADCRYRYSVVAVVGDREYVVERRATEREAAEAAQGLRNVLESM